MVVYLHGYASPGNMWYRIDIERLEAMRAVKSKDGCWKPHAREKIEPFAMLSSEKTGGWTVVGEDIYWAGGMPNHLGPQITSSSLLKHDHVEGNDPKFWKVVSESRCIPRTSPALVYADSKLYVVSGLVDPFSRCGRWSGDWSKCGEIYKLSDGDWEYLNADFKHFRHYNPRMTALVKKDGEPTMLVFYSRLCAGSMLFFDVTSGEMRLHEGHDAFDLWSSDSDTPPAGFEGRNDIDVLAHVMNNTPAVFKDHTFYWFGYDLHLYGYDIRLKRWFQSPCLKHQLPTIKPAMRSFSPYFPVLVDLHNGNLLVVFTERRGLLTMASLTVQKNENTLGVTVGTCHALSCQGHLFVPYDGLAT